MDDLSGKTHLGLQASAIEVPAPAAGPPLPAYLIVLAGGIPGSMLRIQPGPTRIGRAPDNTLALPDPTVSRHQATLRSDEDGRVWINDLGSTNGTFLNGRRLAALDPKPIHDGDRIQFGLAIVVKFVRPDPYEEQFQREMFERTVRDGLTGLYNRSFFLEQADLLADRASRRGLGLAVLMIDVDHFKRINDRFGHPAGDVVLRQAADAIRQATRAEDLVARYGGEEFAVALPIANPEHASNRAERIRRDLAGRRIDVEGRTIKVTVSIGLAFAAADQPRLIANLLSDADIGLYQAKNRGRDRVVCRPAPSASLPETTDDADSYTTGSVIPAEVPTAMPGGI